MSIPYRSSYTGVNDKSVRRSTSKLERPLIPQRQAVIVVVALAMGSFAPAHGAERAPTVDADGTLHAPPLTIPFSSLASPEAKSAFTDQATSNATESRQGTNADDQSKIDIAAVRKSVDESIEPYVAAMKKQYPVNITPKTIGGVYTEMFVPRDGIAPKYKKRVLINLHGGAFLWGARTEGQAESIPIAALGTIKVISVDYRMGPEHQFPAASQDVATVYKALLKDYRPQNIGIYGCSAGGMLTAEAVAWFDKEGLPLPGAIGVLCASTGPISVGDSHFLTPLLTGASMNGAGEGGFDITRLYFGDADPKDPLVYPATAPALLARFPPTLFVTGTRALEMSGVVHSHIQLISAGVRAELYIWDGMWHGFFVDPKLPESKEVYHVIVDFFDRQLGNRPSKARRP